MSYVWSFLLSFNAWFVLGFMINQLIWITLFFMLFWGGNMKMGKTPDPNAIYPIHGYDKEIYIKPTIKIQISLLVILHILLIQNLRVMLLITMTGITISLLLGSFVKLLLVLSLLWMVRIIKWMLYPRFERLFWSLKAYE